MAYLGIKLPIANNINYLFDVNKDTINWIKDNIKNLLLTQKGEKPLDTEFGCNFLSLLFENDTIAISQKIYDEIENCFDMYLPDVSLKDYEIEPLENQINIKITFEYKGNLYDTTLEIK